MRQQAIKKYGLDTLYAEANHIGYATWTYSDGQRITMRSFSTLEGLQNWASRNSYGIVYVN